jgi:uncharacterized membrane protein
LIGFEHLYYLLAIIPVFIAGWILVKRGANHSLIMSRVSVISLLIIALAGPYNPLIVTETDDTPSITVLSDETESMEFFEEGTAQEIFERLQGQTPVSMERMKGLRSDIGDEILSSSERSYHVVVVSDGNNNFGCDLEETIDFISDTGTSIYAITQTPLVNDLSVEITGGRTAVVGNENLVGIEVRQALSDARYRLTVEVDGQSVLRIDETQTAVKKTISFSHTFTSLGPHVITARISSSDDMRTDNNLFNKTVYVVPKPEVLLITSDTESPMYNILNNQYALYTASAVDVSNLSKYKAVVLDNSNNDHISSDVVDKLREYTANGRGLVVVGGDNSFDYGDYLSSELETVLPVESYPSTYAGSVNIVIMMDISGSIRAHQALDDEKAMVISLLQDMGRDTNVGIAAFGSKAVQVSDGLLSMSGHANREALIEKVTNLKTGHGGTSMDEGIAKATEMLDNTSGQKNIIIFSDGAIDNCFDECMIEISSIDTTQIEMVFALIKTNVIKEQLVKTNYNKGEYFMDILAREAGGEFYELDPDQRLDLTFGKESPDLSPDESNVYAVVRLDEEHFITRYLNISGSISGYNDVTQKVGASRLVTTSMGKPVVTSWQFGLGRVVSLSTDNGKFWSGELYSGENARLMPSIINWVVGDPQPDKGLVVYSSDMYLGSPGTITVLSDTLPGVSFGGQEVSMSRTEDRSFEGVLNPVSQGVFGLVVTAGGERIDDLIAVNYPMEYRDVGNNPEFLEAVKRNKGGVYYPEQATSLLFDDIMTNSVRTTVEHVDLRWIALLVALVVFLSEVIVRRVHGIIDIKDRRKGV